MERLTLAEMKEFVTTNRQVGWSVVERESVYGLIERAGAPASTVGAAEISRSLSSLRGELAELDEAIGVFRSAANGR